MIQSTAWLELGSAYHLGTTHLHGFKNVFKAAAVALKNKIFSNYNWTMGSPLMTSFPFIH